MMSRLTGGIGGRGPGETKLEIDRRRVRDRITHLEKRIEALSRDRATRRAQRNRRELPVISIVGYTNAGKSTLLNAITNSSVLAETVRRRRAAGNTGQEVFKALVGLDVSPRRVRDAANLWAALTADRGVGGRDAVWNHPDLIPTASDLDDPLGYVSGESTAQPADDLDAELAKLLAEESGKDDKPGPDDEPDEGPQDPQPV